MNFASQAFSAYQNQQKDTLSPRAIEHRVFSQITSRLELSKIQEDPLKIMLHQALADNLLLWNALAADVATSTNPLPDNLKGQIIYLMKYMHHQTPLVRDGTAHIDSIIDINKMIMAGLAKNPSHDETSTDNSETKGT